MNDLVTFPTWTIWCQLELKKATRKVHRRRELDRHRRVNRRVRGSGSVAVVRANEEEDRVGRDRGVRFRFAVEASVATGTTTTGEDLFTLIRLSLNMNLFLDSVDVRQTAFVVDSTTGSTMTVAHEADREITTEVVDLIATGARVVNL